jgi:tripartite-type tricarboxylate transporter receptor subunit TctC
VPAKTPDPIIKIIHQEALKALNVPDTKDKILAMHQELIGSSQESFEKKFKSDIEKISKLIKDLGIPIQD